MFQQFKNIFPNASLRSITESVGLPETDWNRGVERLEALKSEFQNLNSIFILRQDSTSSESQSETVQEEPSITELEATGNLIETLQKGWDSIHFNNQTNVQKAKTADTKLKQLQSTAEKHLIACERMKNTPSVITAMQSDMAAIESSATQLMQVLLTLEQQIDEISVDYERQQFELWKESQERELAHEIQQKRLLLREKETQLKLQFEEYDSIQKQKKVELYEANFNAELEDYKRRRETQVSSLYKVDNTTESVGASLEQLLIDDKGKDLDQFLGSDEKPKKKSKKKKKVKPVESSDEDERRVEILQDEDYQDF